MSEPEVIYEWMSPQERLARYRRNQGTLPRRVRPCDLPAVELSPEQQAELDALEPQTRLTRFRELQAQRDIS